MLTTKSNGNQISQGENRLAAGIIFLLWVYVALRTFLVPITIDEASTFFHYIQTEEWIPGKAHWDANNHLLNSFLSIQAFGAFGPQEWAIRLPNLFAGLLYLIMAWKLVRHISDKALRWGLFLALTCCSFLLEFFGLSRGYGLSMAFLVTAVYGYLQWQKSESTSHLLLVLVGVGLMVMANMSLLVSGMIIVGMLVLHLILSKSRNVLQYLLTASSVIGFYMAAQYSFSLKERGLLYYGQGDGLWDVTVRSLTHMVYNPIGIYAEWILPATFIMILALVGLFLKSSELLGAMTSVVALPLALLFGNLAANVSMNWILGVNYPEDRVALSYVPFLFISLIMLTDLTKKSWVKPVVLVLSAIFPLQFVATANFSHSVLWEPDRSGPPLIEHMRAYVDSTEIPLPIEAYGLRKIGYDFLQLNTTDKAVGIRPYTENGYLAEVVFTDNHQELDLSEYTLSHSLKWGDFGFHKRNKSWKRVMIQEGSFDTEGQTEAAFQELVNIPLSSEKAQAYLFVPDLKLTSDEIPLPVSMMGQVSDEEHGQIDIHEQPLDRIRYQWQREFGHLNQPVLLDTRSDRAKSLKVFLWNRQMQSSYAAKGTWKLYALR